MRAPARMRLSSRASRRTAHSPKFGRACSLVLGRVRCAPAMFRDGLRATGRGRPGGNAETCSRGRSGIGRELVTALVCADSRARPWTPGLPGGSSVLTHASTPMLLAQTRSAGWSCETQPSGLCGDGKYASPPHRVHARLCDAGQPAGITTVSFRISGDAVRSPNPVSFPDPLSEA